MTHSSATGSPANADHRLFIAGRLALGVIGAAFVPVYLAIYGAPSLYETALLSLMLEPLVLAMLASVTGRLLVCQCLSVAGAIAFGVLLGIGEGPLSSVAAVWLVLAPIEALLSFNVALVLIASAASLIALAGLHVVRAGEWIAPVVASPDGAATAMLALSVLYASALALTVLHRGNNRRALAQTDAARFRALTQAIGDFVLHIDRSGAVVGTSSDVFEGLGLTGRDVIGRALFERIHVGDRPAYLKAVSDAAAGGNVAAVELRVRAASAPGDDGHLADPLFAHVSMRLRRLDLAGETSVVAVLRDVSLLRRHAAELDDARARAESASHWKDRFLANVSHELRTPLNAIIGFSEILGNDELAPTDPDKRREYANIIHSSGEHLLAVVNSILDISKIQAGSFDIVSEPFDLAPLIDQCTKMVVLKAQQANIAIVQDVPTRLEEVVADKRAIKQVLINLLSNAVKFTPDNGVVTIAVRPRGNALTISVSDTGIGIMAKDLARIGDPFFQARGSYDRPYEGTGLGLSVVRGLVGLHGGEMKVESGLGEGTRVTVKLPMDCRQEPEALRGRIASIHTVARGPVAGTPDSDRVRMLASSNDGMKKIA